MKNHQIINGRRLQTNKKWSHLKQNQKIWISEITKKAHENYILKHNKLPIRKNKYEVFDEVADKVNQREIWIPYFELKLHVNKMIDRLNRKNPLFKRKEE